MQFTSGSAELKVSNVGRELLQSVKDVCSVCTSIRVQHLP